MEETVRALPDGAVQETSFEGDALQVDTNTSTTCRNPHQTVSTDIEAASSAIKDHDERNQLPIGSGSSPDEPSSNSPHSHDATSRLTTSTKSTTRALAPDLLRGLLMVLMALDYNSAALNPWPYETALDGEVDNGVPVHKWNRPGPYVIRSLTHLWAPGFTFLLGMGIVYFGRSRRAVGWSAGKMAWHFSVRAVLLTLVTVLLGLVLTLGKIWFLNLVLFALAVDYLLAGLLWMVVSRSEEISAFAILKLLPDAQEDDAREPLLADRTGEEDIAPDRKIMRAADISWHIFNVILLALAVVTIWWNMWLSPTQGHCKPDDLLADVAAAAMHIPRSNWFRIWFYPVTTARVVSHYPPLAWVSFAILGLLYGRVVLARTWTKTALALGNATAGLAFLVILVLTRVLRFGNLSEGCLQMPEHKAHPNADPYLTSWPSFFYLVRYPPEVAFWAYSMCFNFLLLAVFGILPVAFASILLGPLVVYGTSPLFFYVTHLVLLYLTRLVWFPLYGEETGRKDPMTGKDVVLGVDELWVYWLNWALVLAVMYPLCRGYAAFKKTKGPDSIWRFF